MTTPRGPHTFSQLVYAFTSFWEFECCGDPWRVRDVVEVELEPGEPSGRDELAPAPIEWYLGRHGSSGNSPSTVRIRRIWEA